MVVPILKTEDYLLIVTSEDIETDDFFLVESGVGYPINSIHKAILNNDGTKNFNGDQCKRIVAHLPLNGKPPLDNVPLLPELPEFKYSENDILTAFEAGYQCKNNYGYKADGTYQEDYCKFFKELKQTKYPTHFFLDIEINMNGKNGLDRARLIPVTKIDISNNTIIKGRYIN
jgi:hypothetical protein